MNPADRPLALGGSLVDLAERIDLTRDWLCSTEPGFGQARRRGAAHQDATGAGAAARAGQWLGQIPDSGERGGIRKSSVGRDRGPA